LRKPTRPIARRTRRPGRGRRTMSSASISGCTPIPPPTLAGVWPAPSHVIGVVDCKTVPLVTPFEDVADEVVRIVRENQARVMVDASNNAAFVGMLAARLPQPAVNWLAAAAITGAAAHAAQPTTTPISDRRFAERRPPVDVEQERAGRDDRGRGRQQDLTHCACGRLGDFAGGVLDHGAHRAGERRGGLFGPIGQARRSGDGVESCCFRVQALRTARSPTLPRQSACWRRRLDLEPNRPKSVRTSLQTTRRRPAAQEPESAQLRRP
jgi:hypothetical protein